jgi:hypothetical protein
MPESKDLDLSSRVAYSIENLEWWQTQFANTDKLWISTAFKRRFCKTQGRFKQVVANHLRGCVIVLRDE